MSGAEMRDRHLVVGWWKELLLLTALSCLVLLPGLGQMHHLSSREARHAEIIREMSESGDFFVPTLLGKEYYDKPPVFHAVGAVLTRWSGAPSMTTARLPSALAGWLAVLATYGVGRILMNRTTAFVGAIALLGMPGFYGMARNARPDMMLCAAIVLSGFCLMLGMREKRPQMRALAFALGGAFAGVGTLAKGPWGFVFPVLLALMVWFARRDWKLPRVGWGLFAVCLLGVVAAWAIPVYLRDGGRYLSQMLHQSDLQVGEADWDPLSRYLVNGLVLTLPMSLFLPLAVRRWWRQGYSPLLAFALAVLVIFMLIPKKRPHYVLPMYPFLALGIAEAVIQEAAQKKWLRNMATITIGLSVIGVSLYYAFVQLFWHPPEDPDFEVARRLVAEMMPNSRVYVLAMQGREESLAWIGHRKIQVIRLDGDRGNAMTTLQNAPAGSYLATSLPQRQVLESAGVAPRLRLLTEASDIKSKFLLFRISELGD